MVADCRFIWLDITVGRDFFCALRANVACRCPGSLCLVRYLFCFSWRYDRGVLAGRRMGQAAGCDLTDPPPSPPMYLRP